MKDIYFDNSSTSFPKAPNVGRAMGEFIENGAFNINLFNILSPNTIINYNRLISPHLRKINKMPFFIIS